MSLDCKLTVISAWYNEELIAPFFINHYIRDNNVDEIIILLDEDTSDMTLDILEKYDCITIIPLKYPNGFDDVLKINAINKIYKSITDGWVIIVDSDEFIFNNGDIRDFISNNSSSTVIRSKLVHPYRNKSDSDLDYNSIPIVYQRRHGVQENKWGSLYTKPILLKSNQDISFGVGQHHIYGHCNISNNIINGVHWQFADPKIVINRHTKNRKDRLSKENLNVGYSVHFLDFTEENVLRECKEHENDGVLF